MIFPFNGKFKKIISSNKDFDQIVGVINGALFEERGKNQKPPVLDGNCLVFANSFMTRSIFHAIQKGKFCIILNGNDKILTYKFYMYYFFIIYILIGSFIAFLNKPIISKGYLALYIYLLLIWVASVISQKLFFNRIVKSLSQ